MIHYLPPERYAAVRPLFAALDRHLTVSAVIEGTSPGTIYVDDPDAPRAAFIWSYEGNFLAGTASNAAFNSVVPSVVTQDGGSQQHGKREDERGRS
jgi:hypothetical protein